MSRATSVLGVEFTQGSLVRVIGLALAVVLLTGDLRGAEEPLLVGVGLVTLLLALIFGAVSYGEQIEPRLTQGLLYLPLVDKRRASGFSATLIGGLTNTKVIITFFGRFVILTKT